MQLQKMLCLAYGSIAYNYRYLKIILACVPVPSLPLRRGFKVGLRRRLKNECYTAYTQAWRVHISIHNWHLRGWSPDRGPGDPCKTRTHVKLDRGGWENIIFCGGGWHSIIIRALVDGCNKTRIEALLSVYGRHYWIKVYNTYT